MSKSVLIIDDSIPLHKLIGVCLQPESLTLHSAYDGKAGLAAAALLQPGLILLDVNMPRMDGFEVCRQLKANPQTAAIPVIFLTAASGLAQQVTGLDWGALDYFSKPFKPFEILARVRAALHLKTQPDVMPIPSTVFR